MARAGTARLHVACDAPGADARAVPRAVRKATPTEATGFSRTRGKALWMPEAHLEDA